MHDIIVWSIIMTLLISAVIVGYAFEDEIIRIEDRMIKKAISYIVRKLKSSPRFMAWLEEPTISEQISNEIGERCVKILNDWRM